MTLLTLQTVFHSVLILTSQLSIHGNSNIAVHLS